MTKQEEIASRKDCLVLGLICILFSVVPSKWRNSAIREIIERVERGVKELNAN